MSPNASDSNTSKKNNFSFIDLRKISYVLSSLVIIGFALPLFLGVTPNWGIDFAGGIKLQVKLPADVNKSDLKEAINHVGIEPTIQAVGAADMNEYMLSMGLMPPKEQKDLVERLAPKQQKEAMLTRLKNNQSVDVVSLIKRGIEQKIYDGKIAKEIPIEQRIDWQNAESVGPAVGSMLRRDGLKLFLIASLFMILYLSFRFEFIYSIAAMVALFHDLFLISFFVAITGIEINIPVLAALLTLLGYSINDTIVIFDRVRENHSGEAQHILKDTIDASIWQSMSRSLMTSITTLAAVTALIFFGGEGLQAFSRTLFFGVIVGTYSSVFVAAPVLYDWDRRFKSRSKAVEEESAYSSI